LTPSDLPPPPPSLLPPQGPKVPRPFFLFTRHRAAKAASPPHTPNFPLPPLRPALWVFRSLLRLVFLDRCPPSSPVRGRHLNGEGLFFFSLMVRVNTDARVLSALLNASPPSFSPLRTHRLRSEVPSAQEENLSLHFFFLSLPPPLAVFSPFFLPSR